MSLLFYVAACISAILGWKLYTFRRIIRQLARSAQASETIILEEKGLLGRDSILDELAARINELVAEKATIRGAGQAYHAQIQALLGNLREAVVMVDQDNLIHSVNPVVMELLEGIENPLGKKLDALIQGTQFLQFIRDIREKGPGIPKEIEARINQSPRWLEVSAAPLNRESLKGPRYTLFIFHDITRQKKLERMRTEFVANVSHELRTPITIIKGFAETLLEDDEILERAEKIRFLEKIRKNSERLHRLVEDLMLLTRLESTEMVLQKETFCLNGFLSEFLETHRDSGQMDYAMVRLELAEDILIEADQMRLGQVLSNLVENAYRHAKGATEITIKSETRDTCIVLSVTDDGAGIPEKDLPHIFQRFYRVEKGRSRESGGTGLGLSIVKHIVAQHGGQIRAESKVGQGTRIEFSLPVLGSASVSPIE